MESVSLSKGRARRFILAQQGLWPPRQLKGKSGVLKIIRRLGCIQFDPLDIVGRNPELALQARVEDFRPAMLTELLYQERALLDGWDKNMSIYCVEDWPYFRRRREIYRDHAGKSAEQVEAVLPQIRTEIKKRGPLSSIDIDIDQTVDWSWAPTRLARAALESMYNWGELVIYNKVHTRRVYDFANRHLPPDLLAAPEPNLSEEAYHDWYVLRRIGSVGLAKARAGDAWLGMGAIKTPQRYAAIERLIERGELIQVRVAGIDYPLYMRTSDQKYLDIASDDPDPQAAVIAPLDNLLWDRKLVKALFDFEYIWEVYKPVAERQYGYYVLPVLYGDRFVARFEPGRDKENGDLVIKNWWWEPGVYQTVELRQSLDRGFKRFLDYLGAGSIQIGPERLDAAGLDWLLS